MTTSFRFRLVTVLLGLLTVLAFRGLGGNSAAVATKEQAPQPSQIPTPAN